MARTYNPYSDIQKVYNAKVAWNNATTDEERQRQSDIATAARNTLSAYGYSDVAEQISASGADATAARKIMEKYAPKTAQVETNNHKSKEVNRENAGLFDKYNEQYDYLKHTNPFETETGKAILAKYDLAGLQGRDNAVASGGSSNGGNIDSYAAANALRQQASLVNQGKMAVLSEHQQKIDNVRGLLSDMGVNIDRVFNQDETAKNNDVARKSEIASVTGYAPDEWVISNNPYMNDDGTLKEEYKDIDFTTVMENAKAQGNTNAYNAAAQARWYKIMGDYGAFGQYDDGNYIVPGAQQTEAGRQFNKQITSAENIARAENETQKEINNSKLQHEKDLIYLGSFGVTEDEINAMDTAVNNINNQFKDDDVYKSKGNLIIVNGNGSYSLAPGVSVGSYLHPVVKMLVDNSNVTMEQMEYILESIGFKDAYDQAKADGKLDYIFK